MAIDAIPRSTGRDIQINIRINAAIDFGPARSNHKECYVLIRSVDHVMAITLPRRVSRAVARGEFLLSAIINQAGTTRQDIDTFILCAVVMPL